MRFFAVLLLLTLAAVANAAVVGIDLSSSLVKVSLVKPGTPFHMVEDETSKRAWPSTVAFSKKQERFFGNLAKSHLIRHPPTAFISATRLLMRGPESERLKQFEEEGYAFAANPNEDRGTFTFTNTDGREVHPDELLAMYLEYVHSLAKADAPEHSVADCVITVPSFFTQTERKAVLQAAELAGFNVLSLLNENTAAAIQYGINQKYSVNETSEIILYNMGARHTQVSLLRYSGYLKKVSKKSNSTVGQVEVVGTAYDSKLGGDFFRKHIFQFLLEEAKKMFPNDDLAKIPKISAKLRNAAEKTKMVLSANTVRPIYVEGLFKDKDLKTSLTRKAFEEMVQPLLDRVVAPLDELVKAHNLDPSTVDVLVIGGGSRIPAIQKLLKEYIGGRDLKQNLDGDEAIAMGAVFRAANQSVAFQVRKFGVVDVAEHPVAVHIFDPKLLDSEASGTEELLDKRAGVFKKRNRVGKKKTVTLSHRDDFHVEMTYSDEESLPNETPPLLFEASVSGVAALLENEKYTHLTTDQDPVIRLSFLLDESGVYTLAKAEATLEEEVQVAVPKKREEAKKDDAKKDGDVKKGDEAKDGEAEKADAEKADAETAESSSEESGEQAEKSSEQGSGDDAEPAAKKPAAETDEPATATAEDATEEPPATEGETKEDKAEEEEKEEQKEEVEYVTKKKTHRFPLKIRFLDARLTKRHLNSTEMKNITENMLAIKRREVMKGELNQAKNDLEALVYKVRAGISDQLEAFTTEEERENITATLTEAEDWLFDQDDAVTQDNIDNHTAKIKYVNKLSAGAYYRHAEDEARPEMVASARKLFNMTYAAIKKLKKDKEWLPEKDLEELYNMTLECETKLNKTLEEQAKLEKWEDPALSLHRLQKELQAIAKLSRQLYRREKPPPPKKTKEEKEAEKKAKKDKKDKKKKKRSKKDAEDGDEEPKAEDEPKAEKEAAEEEQGSSDESTEAPPKTDDTSGQEGADKDEETKTKDEL